MEIITIISNLFDPFGILRRFIILPLIDRITTVVYNHQLSSDTKDRIRDVAIRVCIIIFAIIVLIWSAIFMYIAFYYTYMPAITHSRPVHVQYEPSNDSAGPCSFPHAHVSLTTRQQLLMVGQPYKVQIHIEMPESIQNQELGMFMVCAEMRDKKTQLRGHSCRSAMLYYQSPMINTMSKILFSPLLIFGFRTERQIVSIEMFSNFEDDQAHPITEVYIEIQSRHIQFYSVTLSIIAHFTGLRYIMFHWPVLSASIGISVNLFFIMIVFVLSWYHWSDNDILNNNNHNIDAINRLRRLNFRKKKSSYKNEIDRADDDADNSDRIIKNKLKKTEESGSTSIDESNNLLDDEDISILDNYSKSGDVDDDGNNEIFNISSALSTT